MSGAQLNKVKKSEYCIVLLSQACDNALVFCYLYPIIMTS